MIIGIDITMLVYAGSGVANYTFNLVKNLLQIDKENEYRLFYSSLRRPKNFYYLEELERLGGRIYNYRFPPTLLQLWWGRFHIVPVEWFIGKVDVFFSSDFLRPPLFEGTKGVTTVHDLTWKLFPQYHEQRIIDAHEKKLEKTIKYRDTIIVDSESTKNDLLKLYPQINENKIHVVYPGIGENFKPRKINNQSPITKYLGKIPDYILYVGAIEPRKNLDRSIEVFSELIKDEKFKDYQFLIVGRAGWKNEKIFQMVKDLNLENKVQFVGYVEDEDLPYFYSAAKLTVYLSSYEGFGLPPLESLSCGTPALAGNNSSMKETLPQEFLVDVKDKKKILEKMKSLLENGIKFDSSAAQRRFGWHSSAEQLRKIFQRLPKRK